jgi:hypothetical protein
MEPAYIHKSHTLNSYNQMSRESVPLVLLILVSRSS